MSTQQSGAGPSGKSIAVLVAMLAMTTLLSQFWRTALAVIAPELIRDLDLSPRMLGLANGGFFASLMFAQVWVGVAFDRFGARRTVGVLSVLMVIGAALHAIAPSGPLFVLARVITGLGCAASFMSALILISTWLPPARWAQGLSWVFGLSQIGILLAGAPLAYVSEAIGWRSAFLGMAVASAAAHFAFYVLVRDRPPGAAPRSETQANAPGAIDGVRQILAIPGVIPVFALFGVAYASVVTISGLWAGPYLKDIHGLDAGQRGTVLTVMALLQMLFVFIYGLLDRAFNTRKWIVMTGALITLSFMIALAAIPDPPLVLALALLFGLSMATNYNPVLLAHMRSHFPDHLAGRGATTGNIAQLLGSAALPIITGFIPPLFGPTGGGYEPVAYRWMFATLALALGVGIAVYSRSIDKKPRPQ